MATQTKKQSAAKLTPAVTVAEYLASAPPDKRAALKKLRRTIKAAAPPATEAISYGIVGFKLDGKPLLYLGYAKDHCALYGSINRFIAAHPAEVRAYRVSKGTLRFLADDPPSDRLVTRIVRARVAEIHSGG